MNDKCHIFNKFGKLIVADVYIMDVIKNDETYRIEGITEYGGKTTIGYIPTDWAIIDSRFFKHCVKTPENEEAKQ